MPRQFGKARLAHILLKALYQQNPFVLKLERLPADAVLKTPRFGRYLSAH